MLVKVVLFFLFWASRNCARALEEQCDGSNGYFKSCMLNEIEKLRKTGKFRLAVC